MHYDQFVGQVQHRARLGSTGDAVAAIRATLETLAERLAGGEAKDLASQLPREIGYYLMRGLPELPQRFGLDEFVWRVSMRAGVQMRRAFFQARVVLEVVSEAVSLGEMEDVICQLPQEFEPLFAGSEGNSRGSRVRAGSRRELQWEENRSQRQHEQPRSRRRKMEYGSEPQEFRGRGQQGTSMGYGQHGAFADESSEKPQRRWVENEGRGRREAEGAESEGRGGARDREEERAQTHYWEG